MGTFTGIPLWILLVILGSLNAINVAHNGKVCSSWGNFHFKNFDGDVFYFPGTCNYVYSSHCKSTYEDFNIQIRRSVVNNVPVIEKITMKIDELVVQIDSSSVQVNGEVVQLPYGCSGVQIEKNGVYLKVSSKLGLVFMWNEDESLLLELDQKYANQTCGLCGDYSSISINNELISDANVTVFRPSSFYIVVETTLGVQIVAQLIPFMQVYVILDPSFKTKTCGLCGNFNDKQTDDFQTINGVIEGTAASFANTWKTQASCPNVKNVYENPCSLSVENEKYAQHWCGLIADPSGPFVACHSQVNAEIYTQNCMFDTCNCEKTEDCMCAALSSYVHACAAKGIIFTGWRSNVCSKYMNTCPKTLNYTYSVTTCQPTCRSLSEPDVTCNVKFVPVDGCTCTKGYYMDDSGKCVPAAACPCYYRGSAVPSGEVVHDNGIQCTCTQGKLSCIGSPVPACSAPMVYFDCKNSSYGTRGAECQKSCQTLDMECYSTKCVSGCVCPQGLVSDGEGKCIAEDQCPCIHNDATYQPGEKVKIKCNTWYV
ncbi:Hypothetical predicted protein [Pelobates cultripes]|uniref:VWFD domain-containing protein n=1 Tax=Pelobates cultripes TaxID=61616 RepID=A0AAD1TEV4_PELCU|nr:Hypothetical predicted protein [Pelobates cultripes]